MIQQTINKLISELPATVKLVAVSKFHPFEAIEQAYKSGQRIFAESRPQELAAKVAHLEALRVERGEPAYMSDIQWHFIGHLQTNKLKMVLPYASLIQSIDSVRLLEAVNAWGVVNSRVVNVLLEPHVAAEDTKQGFSREELMSILSRTSEYANIRFCGIMGMATFTDDIEVVRADFAAIKDIYDSAIRTYDLPHFKELSIGMSDDYRLALDYGSTMVRIGSLIFGSRQ